MIGRLFAVAALSAVLAACAGCVGVNLTASKAGTVFGKGEMITVEYAVEPYTAVEIHGEREGMELYYASEESGKVAVEIQENLAEHVDVSVKEGKLVIKTNKPIESGNGKAPRLYISAPGLEELTVSGGFVIKRADTIKTDSFVLNISGGIDGDLPFEVDKLEVGVSGACKLRFSGSAGELGVWTSGAGAIDALDLSAEKASVNISGAGDVSLSCSDELDINISGTGKVSYKGNPRVTQKISGAASVNRLD